MGRKLDVDQLVGAHDIAERLGLARVERVHELRRRNADFPEPVLTLRQVHIWYWPEIAKWAKAAGRL